jgi:tetratricopeptide (TPR) repeat protein
MSGRVFFREAANVCAARSGILARHRLGLKTTTVVMLVVAAGCSRTTVAGKNGAQAPTFTKDVAPILFERCAPCHRPGMPVPFTLLRYPDAQRNAKKIARAIARREMPPWLPDRNDPAFVGERRLGADEADTIRRWIENGAREGDARDLPAPPKWRDDWELGQPDLVVNAPRAYALPAGSGDIYRNLVLPVSLTGRRFVRAVEFRTNGAPIHHAVIHLDRTSASRRRDGEDGQPGFDGMAPPGVQDPEGQFLGWAPGRGPIVAPDGMPWTLDPGTDLVVELHLPQGQTTARVQPTVALYFTNTPPAQVPLLVRMGSKAIDIPAGQRDYAITDTLKLPVEIQLLSVYPHAHYLGKDMRVTALLPDGTHKQLLHIPQWSFHWQQDYRYVTPVTLPAGATISLTFTYDNSSDNEDNPHNPPRPVWVGPRSTDEMGNLGLQVVPRSPAERAVLKRLFGERELRANVEGAEVQARHAPDVAANQTFLGASYRDVGRLADAIVHLEYAARLDPNSANAHNELGGAYLQANRAQDALAQFQQAAVLAPGDERMHFNVGRMYAMVGRLPEALQEFERALTINPGYADAHESLGALLFSQNRLADALAHLRRAVELNPDSVDAESDLGGALAEAGQFAEAMVHVQRALAIDPNYAPAQENLRRLRARQR